MLTPKVKLTNGRRVAQATAACTLPSPSPPSPLVAGTYYPAASSGASVIVNGTTVGLDIYAPRSLSTPRTKKVLVFVYGGGFKGLTSTPEPAEVEGIGQALISDTSENVLTVVPIQETYTLPTPGAGGTPPPPTPGTTPLAYEVPLDIGCTLAWIQQYGPEYGISSSESPHVTLAGYSSGAGVVASVMLAANQFIPVPQGTLSEITGVLTRNEECWEGIDHTIWVVSTNTSSPEDANDFQNSRAKYER